jgi:hypothetical protein
MIRFPVRLVVVRVEAKHGPGRWIDPEAQGELGLNSCLPWNELFETHFVWVEFATARGEEERTKPTEINKETKKYLSQLSQHPLLVSGSGQDWLANPRRRRGTILTDIKSKGQIFL